MAWVTMGALAALGDVAAADLVARPSATRAAVDARVQPVAKAAAEAAVAASPTVAAAAAAAVASEVAAGAIHAPALLTSGSANDAAAGLHRVDNPASVSNLPSGAGPGLLIREQLRDTYIENGTPSVTYVRRMQESGLLTAGWEVERRERVFPHALTRPMAESTSTVASRAVRIPFRLPVDVSVWRVIIQNRNYRTNATYSGDVTLRTICIGAGARDVDGNLSSSFRPTAQFPQSLAIIQRDVTVDFGAGYTMLWQTRELTAGEDYILSFGYEGATTVHMGMGGGWYTIGNPMNAEIVDGGATTKTNMLPFDVRIEYIDADGVPQDVFIGDSIGASAYSTFAVMEAPPAFASRAAGRGLRAHSFGGAGFADWVGANADPASLKWADVTKHGRADRAFIELGNNDINGGASLATLKTNFEALAGLLKSRVSGSLVACTVTPRTAWVGAQESIRVQFNDWLRTLPAGVSAVADTARAVEDSTGANPRAEFSLPDGIHFTTSGSTALGAEIAAPVAKLSDADAALAAYLAASA